MPPLAPWSSPDRPQRPLSSRAWQTLLLKAELEAAGPLSPSGALAGCPLPSLRPGSSPKCLAQLSLSHRLLHAARALLPFLPGSAVPLVDSELMSSLTSSLQRTHWPQCLLRRSPHCILCNSWAKDSQTLWSAQAWGAVFPALVQEPGPSKCGGEIYALMSSVLGGSKPWLCPFLRPLSR